jgi:AcrR family transcriptional regulator
MEKEDFSEQRILQVAEEEFIKKGFRRVKIIVMAWKAGVSLATFRSYFKTKEEVFQIIFLNKVKKVAVSLMDNHKIFSLEDTIKSIIEHHFDLLVQNPALVNFIYNEVMLNDERRKHLIDTLSSKLNDVALKFGKMVRKEIKQGNIRQISPIDLIMNMFALNVFTFMTFSAAKDLMTKNNQNGFDEFVRNRRESNVQFILNALKP